MITWDTSSVESLDLRGYLKSQLKVRSIVSNGALAFYSWFSIANYSFDFGVEVAQEGAPWWSVFVWGVVILYWTVTFIVFLRFYIRDIQRSKNGGMDLWTTAAVAEMLAKTSKSTYQSAFEHFVKEMDETMAARGYVPTNTTPPPMPLFTVELS